MPNEKYTLNYTAAQVDGAIGKAISIEANPTLAGTEDALTGLQVGDTKYKVDSGISQTDADARYLKLTGGTMSGDLQLGMRSIYSTQGQLIITQHDGVTFVGNTSNKIYLQSTTASISVQKGPNRWFVILDSDNTSANPTLAGTETALTSLKLNGTNYAIAGGTQVTFVDWS